MAFRIENGYTGPIADCHIHLYDPNRQEGVPWPYVGDDIYRPCLPTGYWKIAEPHGITKAIAVEASPWVEDNHWLLRTIKQDPRFLGFVGNLDFTQPSFNREFDVLAQEPLFLGLRYGNLWGRDLLVDQHRPGFVDRVKTFATSGRVLETANPDLRLLNALLLLSDAIPELRIVIDHLPNAKIAPGEDRAFAQQVSELGTRSNVFAKLAEIPQLSAGVLVTDLSAYAERIDFLWEAFGEDRCFFGSDWPNSDTVADFDTTMCLIRRCMARYSIAHQEKFFFLNASQAYRSR